MSASQTTDTARPAGLTLRGLSPEQVLAIADIVTSRFSCTVRDYQALAAIAGASTARFHGIATTEDVFTLARGVERIALALSPLSDRNATFASVVASVIIALNDRG